MRCALKTLKLYTLILSFVMNFAISGSSAIENIALDDNTATVTFAGGRAYDYSVSDVANFVTSLSKVIESGESVGRFVNTAVRNETLQRIAA